jgi:hypothetical protein
MARKYNQKHCPEDDGRVIAPMNLEGMPWYRSNPPPARDENAPPPEKMTFRQTVRYSFSAVGAGLLIVAVFGAAAWLFIEFCIHVWFK